MIEDFENFPLAAVRAERSILGAVLQENDRYFEASQELSIGDFYLDSHRRIYAMIGRLIAEGCVADITTLISTLMDRKELDAVGGPGYVCDLTSGLPFKFAIGAWVRLVKDKSDLRRLAELGSELAGLAEDGKGNAEDLIANLESRLLDIRSGRDRKISQRPSDVMTELLSRMTTERSRTSELLGLPTGIRSLDEMTRGYQQGEFNIIGARSGVGKTSLLAQAAIANARRDTPVLLFSLEMTSQQLLRRILAIVANVPFFRVRDPKWASAQDMEALAEAGEKVAKWPLHIADAAGISIERIVAASKLAIRRDGVKLIGVDYVQIVHAPIKDERLRVSAISRGLTSLAKQEQIPVVALSQLTRPDRSNLNRRPMMSDLRESGQLENDAHAITFIHREWDEEAGRYKSEGELIVAKQRSGETGAFPIEYNRSNLTFFTPKLSQVEQHARTA